MKSRRQKPKHESKRSAVEQALKLLPATISAISVQKKNSFRFSVFVNDEFLIGVSDATLTHFNLRKGVEITPLLFNQINEKEEQWAIREYFIRLLGRRDHARNELRDKARKKGYQSDYISNILDELEEKKYINNLNFAIKFANDKFEFNNWGAVKIQQELIRKGISKSDINKALSRIPKEDINESIIVLIKKNKRKYQRAEPYKRKKKIFDYLLRKGFESNNIMALMPTLLDIIDS
jgi:regulatory protein